MPRARASPLHVQHAVTHSFLHINLHNELAANSQEASPELLKLTEYAPSGNQSKTGLFDGSSGFVFHFGAGGGWGVSDLDPIEEILLISQD